LAISLYILHMLGNIFFYIKKNFFLYKKNLFLYLKKNKFKKKNKNLYIIQDVSWEVAETNQLAFSNVFNY